jgi:2'-5' RNA ligase
MNSITEDHGSEDRACVMLKPIASDRIMLEKLIGSIHKNIENDGNLIEAETDYHVTLLYGLLEDNQLKVRQHLMQTGMPMNTSKPGNFVRYLTIKSVSLFENEKYDVLKFDFFVTEWLQEMHDNLKYLPNDYTFDEYRPHMTIAYVKSGKGSEYITDELKDLEGKTIIFNKIVHTGFKDVNENRIHTEL